MMLYEGFEKAKSAGRGGLENFHQLRSIVNTAKPKAQDHPVYQRLNSAEVRGELGENCRGDYWTSRSFAFGF